MHISWDILYLVKRNCYHPLANNISLITCCRSCDSLQHYDDVTMSAMASQMTSITIVYSIVYSDADQRKHQSPASLVFVLGIQRGRVNSPHKWPVTRKMSPFDDVIMAVPLDWVQFCLSKWPPLDHGFRVIKGTRLNCLFTMKIAVNTNHKKFFSSSFFFHEEGFQLPLSCQCRGTIWIVCAILYFLWKI